MAAPTATAAALAAALVAAGCAGPVARSDGGWRHRKHDYAIADPGGPGPAWQRFEVEGADLAFRRPGPDTLSLLSRCGRPVAGAQLMARHLVMGERERRLVAAQPIEVAGRSGWLQSFEVEREGKPVRVETLTLVVGDCTFDWVLASAGDFASAESAFRDWWGSFRLGKRHAGEPSS
jgi:hypothetical protein